MPQPRSLKQDHKVAPDQVIERIVNDNKNAPFYSLNNNGQDPELIQSQPAKLSFSVCYHRNGQRQSHQKYILM